MENQNTHQANSNQGWKRYAWSGSGLTSACAGPGRSGNVLR